MMETFVTDSGGFWEDGRSESISGKLTDGYPSDEGLLCLADAGLNLFQVGAETGDIIVILE